MQLNQWMLERLCNQQDIKTIQVALAAFEQQFGLSPWDPRNERQEGVDAEVIGECEFGGWMRPIVRICHNGMDITMTRLPQAGKSWVVSVCVDEVNLNLSWVVPFWRNPHPSVYNPFGHDMRGDEFPHDRRFPTWSGNDAQKFSAVLHSEYVHTFITLVLIAHNAAS